MPGEPENYSLWHDPLQGKDVLPNKTILVDEFFGEYVNVAKQELGKIVKAWSEGGIVDGRGEIWLNTRNLAPAIRTIRLFAKIYLSSVRQRDRVRYQGDLYVRGPAVVYMINNVIQDAGNRKRQTYAEISEKLFRKIRQSPEAKLRQRDFWEHMKESRKQLKRKRIAQKRLELDELTGEELLKRTAEFSHIRSASCYFEYCDKVWNGLVVNKETHQKITAAEVTDERDLLSLCKANGWNEIWTSEFENRLKAA